MIGGITFRFEVSTARTQFLYTEHLEFHSVNYLVRIHVNATSCYATPGFQTGIQCKKVSSSFRKKLDGEEK